MLEVEVKGSKSRVSRPFSFMPGVPLSETAYPFKSMRETSEIKYQESFTLKHDTAGT
jgi:hypothetical protein